MSDLTTTSRNPPDDSVRWLALVGLTTLGQRLPQDQKEMSLQTLSEVFWPLLESDIPQLRAEALRAIAALVPNAIVPELVDLMRYIFPR